MTKQKDLKSRIREHIAKTGKSYTAARIDVLTGSTRAEGISGSGVAQPSSEASTTVSRDERGCPGCNGVLARGTERKPAGTQDLIGDLEEIAELLIIGTANHAWRGDAAGCEKLMMQAAMLAWRDAGLLGYGFEQRGASFFEAKLPERVAALPCAVCGRSGWTLPLEARQLERIADDFTQIITMLVHGVAKYARRDQPEAVENMMGQALRQLRFSFIALGLTSRWQSNPVYLKVVEEWEWEPPFEPPSTIEDDDANEARD